MKLVLIAYTSFVAIISVVLLTGSVLAVFERAFVMEGLKLVLMLSGLFFGLMFGAAVARGDR